VTFVCGAPKVSTFHPLADIRAEQDPSPGSFFIELIARAARIPCERHHLLRRPTMNVEQMLQQTNAIDAISRELGVDPATVRAGATALMPSILSGFQNPTNTHSAIGGGAPAVAPFLAVMD